MPVPDRDWMPGELTALLTNEILPDAPPLIWGVNAAVKEALWPAAIVRGKDTPLNVNSELLDVPEEIVTLEPVAANVPL